MATTTLTEPITTRSVETLDVAIQVAWVHALFYFVAGLWPLVSFGTFTEVVGNETAPEIIRAIGVVMVATSAGLFFVLRRHRLSTPIVAVAMAVAFALAAFDFYYLVSGGFTIVRLADLLAQGGLFVSWVVSLLPGPRT